VETEREGASNGYAVSGAVVSGGNRSGMAQFQTRGLRAELLMLLL
jgi:hypothetical protein